MINQAHQAQRNAAAVAAIRAIGPVAEPFATLAERVAATVAEVNASMRIAHDAREPLAKVTALEAAKAALVLVEGLTADADQALPGVVRLTGLNVVKAQLARMESAFLQAGHYDDPAVIMSQIVPKIRLSVQG